MPWGKIIKALSGYYYVLPEEIPYAEEKLIQCRARGLFRKQGKSPLVGDWVRFESKGEKEGWIEEISERKNVLIRPPVANMDIVVLLFSLKEPELNLLLLDRFLAHIEHRRVPILIGFTKIDLVEEHSWKSVGETYEKIGYPIVATSARTGRGVDEIRLHLQGKTAVFAGQSGVGKSSLLNSLLPKALRETGEISRKLGRGRHTTRHVELLSIGQGSFVADTPGFGQLDFLEMDPVELTLCFPEIRSRAGECRFRECLHHKEPGCAVREAVTEGEIQTERYEHYLIFLSEIKKAMERRYR
ncbi:ribosome small subunit-dependent GTPase A [Thermicanus aegyptius]|uniref:ribosome small subunit-dependent GTPase A n=1 Tax=Thermicanus aegyptius TaxID=94009 RepID=UPI000406BA79|nr:ribosome small subunit-dependent GTPase A [Thermicanus aegyptius]